MLKKLGATPMPDLQLPYMTLIPIWDEKPQPPKVRKLESAKPAPGKKSGRGDSQEVGKGLKPAALATTSASGKPLARESETKDFRKLEIVRQAGEVQPEIQVLQKPSPANVAGETKLVGRLVD